MIHKAIPMACAIALAAAFGPGFVQAEEAAATPPAKTATDPMSTTYGNTILLEILPFWSAKQYYEPDHTWRQVASDGKTVGGTWKIENGQSCTLQTTPPGPTYCNVYVPRKVGDTWTNHDDAGNTTIISLVAGRE
jgi:hypothetical protein